MWLDRKSDSVSRNPGNATRWMRLIEPKVRLDGCDSKVQLSQRNSMGASQSVGPDGCDPKPGLNKWDSMNAARTVRLDDCDWKSQFKKYYSMDETRQPKVRLDG